MAEELEILWAGLKLIEKEREEVNLTEDETKRAEIRGQNCLVMLFLMDKNINNEAFGHDQTAESRRMDKL